MNDKECIDRRIKKAEIDSDLRSDYLSLVEQDERLIKIINQLQEQRKELNKKIKKQELLLKNNKKNNK